MRQVSRMLDVDGAHCLLSPALAMTPTEIEVFTGVCDYLEALLDDCVRLGLPQDAAADMRLCLAAARALLANTHYIHGE